MKRLFVLMSCAVSLCAFASGEQAQPKAVWVPAPATATAPAPAKAQVYKVTPYTPAPVDMNRATVIQVPAGSNVTVVTAPAAAPARAPTAVVIQGERPVNDRVPFRAGVSTVTGEKLAQAVGCVGGQGAGLMTPQGPVEIYRMMCESGQVYMAKCELRQCRTVSATPMGGYAAMTESAAREMRQSVRRTEVPSLVLDWRCGSCVPNAAFAAALRRAYAAEAGRNGMSVNADTSTVVSIVQFAKRAFPIRNTLGMNAAFGRQAINVQESTTAFTGMDLLAEVGAKKLFQGLRGKN